MLDDSPAVTEVELPMTAFAAGLVEPKLLSGTSWVAPNAPGERGAVHAIGMIHVGLPGYDWLPCIPAAQLPVAANDPLCRTGEAVVRDR